jgi:ATP-dependent helicase/nuclease subunit A
MEVARDEVRVMTVHGAKGLEAPVVILADTVSPPAPPQRPLRLIPLPDANAPPAPDRLVWAQAKSTDVPQITAAKAVRQQAAEDEYRRLLYVAMTRAADCLIVCGAEGQRARPKGCWYDLVFDALSPLVTETKDEDGGTVWRMEKSVAEEAAAAAVSKGEAAEIPPWLKRDVPPFTPAFVLNPSSAMEDLQPTAVFGIGGAERSRALARGRLIHRLMQSLPDIAPDRRAAAARTFLSRAAATTFDDTECHELAAQALAVINDPRFAPLAGPGSRAEVPVVGRVSLANGAPVHVSGQIDRMAVTADAVIFADYKTNRPAPRRIDDVPKDYLVQLALYRALLAGLYPERTIRAALIWTDIPGFMDIPPAALDAALARITPA